VNVIFVCFTHLVRLVQEAQQSLRNRAMLRVTEYFTSHSRSLEMTLLSTA